MIVADAPHLSESKGEPLFTPDGEPAPVLLKVREVLTNLQRDHQRTLQLLTQIQAAELLIEQELTVRTRAGATFALKGLRVVDTARFAALSADTLHDLHRSGALTLIHAHLLSLSNLRDGPLSQAEAPVPVLAPSDTLSFEGIDWSHLQ